VRARVDAAKCSGHGRCYGLYGDAYTDDEDGFNAARGETVEIASGHEESAVLGAKVCPEGAILLFDE